MARNVLVETGGVRVYTPGRSNLGAAKRGERDKSSARSESSESGRERGSSRELLERFKSLALRYSTLRRRIKRVNTEMYGVSGSV